MDVIFLYGRTAAGKDTIGRLLSTLMDLPLFQNHLVVNAVSALFESGTEPFLQLREEMWLAAFTVAADASRSFIFTFNPETMVDAGLIKRLQDVVEKRGGRILYAQLICSDAGVAARIDNPDRAQSGKLIDADLYWRSIRARLKKSGGYAAHPLPESFVTVDTEVNSPIESARLIERAYAAGKLK